MPHGFWAFGLILAFSQALGARQPHAVTTPIATRRLDLGVARAYAENDALAWRSNCGAALDSKM
mgnify:CR=1 FL=1